MTVPSEKYREDQKAQRSRQNHQSRHTQPSRASQALDERTNELADAEELAPGSLVDAYYKDQYQMRMPAYILASAPKVFEKMAFAIFERLTDPAKQVMFQRFFGHHSLYSESSAREIMAWMAGKGPEGINYFEVFARKYTNGHFESFYPREEELTRNLENTLYREKIRQNYKIATEKIAKRKDILQQIENNSEAKTNAGIFQTISPMDVLDYDLDPYTTYDSAYEDKEDDIEQSRSVSFMTSEKDCRNKKAVIKKNVMTIIKSSPEEVTEFQQQEHDRYRNPTRPFIYTLKNGEQRCVAPVCKKLMDASVKARDHFLLKPERPACVTLLSLVRDAACKLPKGYGTRNDICELLKESQFINLDVDEEKMSSVVSGALDRLHYEKDPCVRFDSAKKLWFYLHITRTEEDFADSDTEPKAPNPKSRHKKIKRD